MVERRDDIDVTGILPPAQEPAQNTQVMRGIHHAGDGGLTAKWDDLCRLLARHKLATASAVAAAALCTGLGAYAVGEATGPDPQRPVVAGEPAEEDPDDSVGQPDDSGLRPPRAAAPPATRPQRFRSATPSKPAKKAKASKSPSPTPSTARPSPTPSGPTPDPSSGPSSGPTPAPEGSGQ